MAANQIYRRIFTYSRPKVIKQNASIKGVIFDMDGTLTVPVLDFKGLRSKLGISASTDLLEFAISSPTADMQNQVLKMIADCESEGIAKMKLRPYLHQLLYFLKEERVNVALLTRNTRIAVDAFIKEVLAKDTRSIFQEESDIFSMVLTRDFTPVKPHPAAVEHICSQWNVSPHAVLVVGDDVRDIACGQNAGSVTTLVNKPGTEELKEMADFDIDCLSELIAFLKKASI